MQITEITASWGETVNLGNYENARVDLRLTARLEPGEDVARAYDDLLVECRVAAQEQADAALERADQAAKYSPAPRFDVLRRSSGLIAIVPAGMDLPEGYTRRYGLRLGHARTVAQKLVEQQTKYDQATITECLDADAVAALAERLRAEDERKRAEREASVALQPRGEPVDDFDDEHADEDDEEED